MTRYWEAGTQYNYGDIVQYEGHRYKIIQPHFSQGDWTPPVTPALWGRLSDGDDCDDCGDAHKQAQGQCQPKQPDYSQQRPQYQDDKPSEQTPAEPAKQHWYDDDSTKKKVEIGAGVAAGAALLAGGLLAYKKHEQHKEEGKARVWARDTWLAEARARTESLRSRGPEGPAGWVLVRGKSIPRDAIPVGEEHGRKLYSSRTFYEGALVVGKASEEFDKGSVIGYADKEIEVDEYEVLVGDQNRLRWVSTSGKFKVEHLGSRPVEGGHEANGTLVYIVRAPYKGATHPGKTSEELNGAYITYGGKEVPVKEYQVLCYN
jgi:hypothetical protein